MGQLSMFSRPSAQEPPSGYDHVIRWGRPSKALPPYNPPLKGERCRLRCRGRGRGPHNVAVELTDGRLLVMPRWAVMRCWGTYEGGRR